MTTPTLFKEYIWLVNTIYRAGRISLSDINKKWIRTEMSGGVEIPRTTFNRHKEAIEDIFGIYIDCDRKDGYRYYIGNGKVLREDTVQNWMLSTLTVSNKKPKTFPTLNITFVPQPISKGKSCPEVPGSKSSNPNGWHMKSANGTRMPSRGTKKNSLGTLGFILVSQSFQSF